MAKYFATQTLTITYGKYIEANSRDEALNIACQDSGDLDNWQEVDCESGDSVYIDDCYEEAIPSHNTFKLDTMLSDTDPIIQVCFETTEWELESTKLDIVREVSEDLETMGLIAPQFDIDNEIKYFDDLETVLNDAGFYTYNSDSWFEVYDPQNVTQAMLDEIQA